MAITPLELEDPAADRVDALRAELLEFASRFRDEAALLSTLELTDTVAAVEELSKAVEYLQLLGARAAEERDIAAVGEHPRTTGPAAGADGWADPAAALAADAGPAGHRHHRGPPPAPADSFGAARPPSRRTWRPWNAL